VGEGKMNGSDINSGLLKEAEEMRDWRNVERGGDGNSE